MYDKRIAHYLYGWIGDGAGYGLGSWVTGRLRTGLHCTGLRGHHTYSNKEKYSNILVRSSALHQSTYITHKQR